VAVDAHELVEQAEHFRSRVAAVNLYSHLEFDAHRLAESVEHFHELVEKGEDYSHLREDFNRVNVDYHLLLFAWNRTHSEHHDSQLAIDFLRVENAYLTLRRSMRYGHFPKMGK